MAQCSPMARLVGAVHSYQSKHVYLLTPRNANNSLFSRGHTTIIVVGKGNEYCMLAYCQPLVWDKPHYWHHRKFRGLA